MRRILSIVAALTLAASFAMPAPVSAQSRTLTYPAMNPSSTLDNSQKRYVRLTLGTFMWNAFSSSIGSGQYVGASVIPNGGMNVAVQPTTTNNPGSIYQVCQDDTKPLPQAVTPQLSADPTQIVCLGLVTGTSGSYGPMTAPGAGTSQYYLLETQLQPQDTSSQSVLFVSPTGGNSTQTLPTVRVDQPQYQLKAGVASSSPSIPSADSGWFGIATILVPSGTSTITAGMIAALPPWAGFVSNGANVTLSGLTLSSAGAGCLQTNSSGVVSAQTCTSGLGTVNATSPIVSTTSNGVATVSCPTCVASVTGGTGVSVTGSSQTPVVGLSHGDYLDVSSTNQTKVGGLTTASVTAPPAGTATSSVNYGSTTGFQVQNSLWNGSSATTNTWSTIADNSGNVVRRYNGTVQETLSNTGALSLPSSLSAAGLTNTAFSTAGVVVNNASGVLATSTAPSMSGANITAGTVPNAALVTPALTGLTAGTGVSVGTGTTPSVGLSHGDYGDLANAQTFTGAKTFTSKTYVYDGNSFLQADGEGVLSLQGSSKVEFGNVTGSYGAFGFINGSGYQIGSSTYGPSLSTGSGTFSGAVTVPSPNGPGITVNTAANSYFQLNFPAQSGASMPHQYTWTYNNGFAGQTAPFIVQDQTASSNLLLLDPSGNVTVSGAVNATSFNGPSRREWKTNIVALSPQRALDIALHTPIIRFCYNGAPASGVADEHCKPGEERHTGFAANNASTVISGPEHRRADYSAMASVAFAAIYRQEQLIDALTHDVKVLHDRLAETMVVKRVIHHSWHRKVTPPKRKAVHK